VVTAFSLVSILLLAFQYTGPVRAEANHGTDDSRVFQVNSLSLQKTVSKSQPLEGEVITYTVALKNNGGITVTNVTVIDTPEDGLNITGGQAPAPTTFNLTDRSWSIPSIGAGESLTLTLNAVAVAGTGGEGLGNQVSIAGTSTISATEVITPQNAADIVVAKFANKQSVQPGESLSYIITVRNNGTRNASNVVITDLLPANLENITQSNSGNINPQSQGLNRIWQLTNPLNVGAAFTIIITGTVDLDANTGDSVQNSVRAETSSNEGNRQNNSASVSTPVQRQASADLDISKRVNTTSPHELENIIYTVVLENNGPNTVTQFTVIDTFPSQLTFVNARASIGTFQSNTWTGTNVTLAPGGEATLTITATVNLNTVGNNIVNTVTRSASTPPDPDGSEQARAPAVVPVKATLVEITVLDYLDAPIVGATVVMTDSARTVFVATTNNSGVARISSTSAKDIAAGVATFRASRGRAYLPGVENVNVVRQSLNEQTINLNTTDLVVTKADTATASSPGATVDYTIRITNNGSITATNITITDTLGTGLEYITFITNTITTNPARSNLRLEGSPRTTPTRKVWTMIGSLGPTTSTTRSYTFIVRARVASNATGSVTNTVLARTASPEANTANNTATDTNTISSGTTTNITVTKSASPQEVRPAQSITFQIDIRNTTSGDITITSITDAIPATFESISASIGPSSVVNVNPQVNQSTRNVTVPSFTMNAGESARLLIAARVLSTASGNTTGTNTVNVFIQGGGSRTASATYRVVAQGTLPGTGFGPPVVLDSSRFTGGEGGVSLSSIPHPRIEPPQAPALSAAGQSAAGRGQRAAALAFFAAFLLGLAGAAAAVYGFRSRGKGSEWGVYAARLGLAFLALALVFGLAGWGLRAYRQPSAPAAAGEPGAVEDSAPLAMATVEIWLPPSVPENDLPALPDFPIPVPQVSPTPGQGAPDSSPITRISIPSIGVNNEVKYVPYDGFSWLIAGLRHEVAWLGETSWPGLGSNTALAAHVNLRGGENGPFRYLEDLIAGDVVRVYTEENEYVYKVRLKRVVGETDLTVIEDTGTPQLTLITCTGWDEAVNFYLQRTVVFADLYEVTPRSGQTNSQ
jgi:LPXTG-site transpeptidase (sortase) family protein